MFRHRLEHGEGTAERDDSFESTRRALSGEVKFSNKSIPVWKLNIYHLNMTESRVFSFHRILKERSNNIKLMELIYSLWEVARHSLTFSYSPSSHLAFHAKKSMICACFCRMLNPNDANNGEGRMLPRWFYAFSASEATTDTSDSIDGSGSSPARNSREKNF